MRYKYVFIHSFILGCINCQHVAGGRLSTFPPCTLLGELQEQRNEAGLWDEDNWSMSISGPELKPGQLYGFSFFLLFSVRQTKITTVPVAQNYLMKGQLEIT